MCYRLKLMLMAMTLFSPLLHAEENEVEDVPAADFLEFLGEWETAEGEWINPAEFDGEAYITLGYPDGNGSESNEQKDD